MNPQIPSSSLLKQTREYVQFRRLRHPERSRFLRKCAKDPKYNVFCQVEAERFNRRTKDIEAADGPLRLLEDRAIQDVKSGNLADLAQLESSVVNRAVENVDDPKVIRRLAQNFLKTNHCQYTSVQLPLAGKLEEFFPDPSWIHLAAQVYAQAGACESDTFSGYEKFRSALLLIWEGNCNQALPLLASSLQDPDSSHFRTHALYWQYDCAQKTDNLILRKSVAQSLWDKYPLSLANILVNQSKIKDVGHMFPALPASQPMTRSVRDQNINNLIGGIEALVYLHQDTIAGDVVFQTARQFADTEVGVQLHIVDLMSQIGSELPQFKLLAQLFDENPKHISMSLLKMYFPLWHLDWIQKESGSLDPLLVMSLVRQESAFNPRAESPVGARGLMQVLPSTARRYRVWPWSLYQPMANLRVGSLYFARRLQKYSGNVEYALAAYNAGFGRLDEWLQRYPVSDPKLFLDLMPYFETREYVSTILRNYYWYVKLDSRIGSPSPEVMKFFN